MTMLSSVTEIATIVSRGQSLSGTAGNPAMCSGLQTRNAYLMLLCLNELSYRLHRVLRGRSGLL